MVVMLIHLSPEDPVDAFTNVSRSRAEMSNRLVLHCAGYVQHPANGAWRSDTRKRRD